MLENSEEELTPVLVQLNAISVNRINNSMEFSLRAPPFTEVLITEADFEKFAQLLPLKDQPSNQPNPSSTFNCGNDDDLTHSLAKFKEWINGGKQKKELINGIKNKTDMDRLAE